MNYLWHSMNKKHQSQSIKAGWELTCCFLSPACSELQQDHEVMVWLLAGTLRVMYQMADHNPYESHGARKDLTGCSLVVMAPARRFVMVDQHATRHATTRRLSVRLSSRCQEQFVLMFWLGKARAAYSRVLLYVWSRRAWPVQ